MVRYSGEFVVQDTAGAKKYLADLLYGWDIGDDLTGWTLGGTTIPTIATDGWIRLYDAVPGAGTTSGFYPMPGSMGEFMGVFHFKVIRKADDTSLELFSLFCGITADALLNSGMNFQCAAVAPLGMKGDWFNANIAGVTLPLTAVVMPTETEYTIDIIMTQNDVIFLVNGVRLGSIPRSNKGTITSLSEHQNREWRAGLKRACLYSGHAAGTVSHHRIHDIKVGRLVGVEA
jgi:hypothetical protein